MITSFEVGTVFKIVDEATPTLDNLYRELMKLEELSAKVKKNFQSLGSLQLGNLNRSVTTLTEQAVRMESAYGKAFTEIEAGTGAAIKQTQSLATEWRNVAVASASAAKAAAAAGRSTIAGSVPMPGTGGNPSPGTGGGSGRGSKGGDGDRWGTHIGQRGDIPGGTHYAIYPQGKGGMLAMILAGTLGYGALEEAKIERQITYSMLATGQKIGPHAMEGDFAKQMHDRIMAGARETGLGPADLAEASKSMFLQMNGMPNQQILNYLPDAYRFAAIEKGMKDVGPKGSMEALTSLLHMSGNIEPDKMRKIMGQFAFASTISPVGLPGITRAASYAVPFATAAHLDAGSLLLVIAQMQSAGITNTKGGTWIQAGLQSLSKNGNMVSLLTGHGSSERIKGLKRLGLLGQKGENIGLNMLLKNDWIGFAKLINDHLNNLPQDKVIDTITQATGSKQAARFMSLFALPSFTQLLPELMKEQKQFAANPEMTLQQLMQTDPVMKVEADLQVMNTQLIQLGSEVLPSVVKGIDYLSTGLSGLGSAVEMVLKLLPGGKGRKGAIKKGMGGGAAAGALVGGVLGSVLPGPGTMAGAAIGATLGAGAGGAYEGYEYDGSDDEAPELPKLHLLLRGQKTPTTRFNQGWGVIPNEDQGLLHKQSYVAPENKSPLLQSASFFQRDDSDTNSGVPLLQKASFTKRSIDSNPLNATNLVQQVKSSAPSTPKEAAPFSNAPLLQNAAWFQKDQDDSSPTIGDKTNDRYSDQLFLLDAMLYGQAGGGGGVGGGSYQSASYEPDAGTGGGGSSGTVPSILRRSQVGAGAGRGLGRNKPGTVPMGHSGPSPDDASLKGLTGNEYIKGMRAGFAKELQNPALRVKMAAMLATEGSGVLTAESAMNRANASHKNLASMLTPGFYGPMRHPGSFNAVMARLSRNPKEMAKYNKIIDAALAGSDAIHGFTDQGMWNDPNGPGKQLRKLGHQGPYMKAPGGGNYYNDWHYIDGDRTFMRWRQQFESRAHAAPSTPPATATLPPKSDHHSDLRPVILKMDGRTVARSTMQHMVKMANAPTRGARMADYTAIRQNSV